MALARALVFEPQLVLMDEPLGALDKQLREHMQLEIKHIHENLGVTVVYVTHDQSEALTMSDRVAVFDKGEIQQIDPAETLYEAPVNSFVAGFIGESNAISGTIEHVDGDFCQARLIGGGSVSARAVCVRQAGQPTTLSIRPERVMLGERAVGCANRFDATIAEFIYLGDHLRLRLDFAGNSGFMVKVPVPEVDPAWQVGNRLSIGWRAEDLRALDPLAV